MLDDWNIFTRSNILDGVKPNQFVGQTTCTDLLDRVKAPYARKTVRLELDT